VDGPPSWASDEPEAPPATFAAPAVAAPPSQPAPDPQAASAAREAIRQTRSGDEAADSTGADALAAADADASPDDLDADSEHLGTDDLLARELGAEVIEEIRHP